MSPSARFIAVPTALAAALAAAYLIAAPASQDLAAATFRADLFAEHGFVLWNNDWYSGHYLLSYSVLYPPLAVLVGIRLVGALAVVAAAAIFARLASERFGERALWPSLWFAAALGAWLLTGRMTFLLAVPFGLAAIALADRERLALAGLAAAVATLASPVAGLFTGIAGAALFLTGERAKGLWLGLGAAVPMLALNLAFPVGGEEPFVFSAFIALPLLAALVLWLVPAQYAAIRVGAVLYALLALAVFVLPNPLGGNITRLGALFAGPLLMLLLWPRGRLVVIAVSLPLLYWQLVAPVRDVRKGSGDPSTERAFYEPLLSELERLPDAGEFRIQIPPTANRWEAAYVAPEYPIARGWLRQLESDDFDLFSDGNLDAAAYLDWLEEHGVSYVAVPAAPRDYIAEDEVELIDAGLEYLEPVWESDNWRLYRVEGSDEFGLAGRGVEPEGPDRFGLEVARPGTYSTSISASRYWQITAGEGCLRPHGDGDDTVVEAFEGEQRIIVEQRFGIGAADECSE